ncbi:protease SohB [Umboniibacter marinipuniceus]|uniref:Serine protease SohB n=1 Tax=Umboniibacter marinipuniceus TaxID=569599 RepID=A0A3M0AE66_9GAMM|nr:protease SohB [Umboniibacter marinipuniceus]RMA81058.1 serine protease SohB [Umboniibacter marinipuniceus]
MEFLAEYGLFLAESITVVIAIAVVIGLIANSGARKSAKKGEVSVTDLNGHFEELEEAMFVATASDDQIKRREKALKKTKNSEKKAAKKAAKASAKTSSKADEQKEDASASDKRKPIRYVINFDGDVKASAVENLREEVSAILIAAEPCDEVVVRLESPGGMVHAYGLAAAQLERIKAKKIPLTICVDQVAASGGYMMACLADRIIASPFALLGSIGVVAQMPNIHRLLKKNHVDVELHTAGKFKRTLTMLGENTDEGREKFQEELEEVHRLFRDMVAEARPKLDIDAVATGEAWYGKQALALDLVDELQTSDEYLFSGRKTFDQYLVQWSRKKSVADKVGLAAQTALTATYDKLLGLTHRRDF